MRALCAAACFLAATATFAEPPAARIYLTSGGFEVEDFRLRLEVDDLSGIAYHVSARGGYREKSPDNTGVNYGGLALLGWGGEKWSVLGGWAASHDDLDLWDKTREGPALRGGWQGRGLRASLTVLPPVDYEAVEDHWSAELAWAVRRLRFSCRYREFTQQDVTHSGWSGTIGIRLAGTRERGEGHGGWW